MCLAIPGKVIDVKTDPADPVNGRTGTVDFNGSQVEASLAMTPDAQVGSWVLVHAGFAISELDEEEARKTWQSIQFALGDDIDLGDMPE